jgi:cation diffusion facilitator family transporter
MAKRIFVVPHVIVFFVAMMSALVNGLIHKFAHCSAKELNSPVLKAHAEHNKIDVISSLMVAVTIPAARMGLHWVDPLVAIIESVHVLWGSWAIFWEGLKGAMDSSLTEGYNDNIAETCLEVGGVEKVSKVRSRQLGRKVFLDLIINADPELSVLESQQIVSALKAHLRAKDRHIGKIQVQVVPAEK